MSTSILEKTAFESMEPEEIRLGPDSNGMLMTPDEFDAVEDWDELFKYELVHGVVVVNPPPGHGERDPDQFLGHLLLGYKENHPSGDALDLTLPQEYIRVEGGRRIADRVVWAGLGRLPKPLHDPPTIAVEFVSRRKRDRHRDYVEKRREYLDAGVRKYWIIDRFRRRMTVCRADAADMVVQEQDTYRTDVLPGFELPLAKLLEQADRWKDTGEQQS